MKIAAWLAGVIVLIGVLIYAAFQLSPWPSALVVRSAFQSGGAATSRALEKHVPPGVSAQLNLRYDEGDGDARLDVFYPSAIEKSGKALPTVVWVHGGGWVAGNKNDVANYARILAARGYTVVGVNYSIAPGATYPVPVRQVNAALGYLAKNAQPLHIDAKRFVLAGDSAGAHIASQVANAISVPSYAKALGIVPTIDRVQLVGVLLYCGAYDMRSVSLDGQFGNFLKTVLWSYSGGRDFMENPAFETASVINYVTAQFPPAFISAGNGDPLLLQSRHFAEILTQRRVKVDSLFFATDHSPPLGHEYQFDLDSQAGRQALERSVKFLSGL